MNWHTDYTTEGFDKDTMVRLDSLPTRVYSQRPRTPNYLQASMLHATTHGIEPMFANAYLRSVGFAREHKHDEYCIAYGCDHDETLEP